MPKINCLRQTVKSGGNEFPLYIGFLPAKEILQVAEAPSFTHTTEHREIANNILSPPIGNWQRPINPERVRTISDLFDNTGEFMPNPVLLCENVVNNLKVILIEQQRATGGIPTNIWEITLPEPTAGSHKPLWILDGQHRIDGLANSLQSDNVIPVVLLLNEGLANPYSGPLLAKIFAQVTTSATKLDELHNEWLTFAFNLDRYDSRLGSEASQHKQAMEAVAELCRTPLALPPSTNNPIFNEIKFNIHVSVNPRPGGFTFSCIDWKDLFRANYYSNSATVGAHLSPKALAQQISFAFIALTQVVTAPLNESVFFGTGEYGQEIMQDAFIIGVLSYLLQHGAPTSWVDVLENLSFKTTDWNFKSWVRTLSGPAQTTSKNLAASVFRKVFQERSLPSGPGNLRDFLHGNNARVTMQFSHIDPGRVRPSRRNFKGLEVPRGAVLSESIAPRKHLKISYKSENIGKLTITDKSSPPGRIVEYRLGGSGMILDPVKHSNPLQLLIRMEHYGGIESTADLSISW